MTGTNETHNWNIDIGVTKWDAEATAWLTRRLGRAPVAADFEAAKVKAYEDNVHHGNLLTTAGLTRITSLIVAGGGQALTNTSGRIGVGNSSTAAAVGQTDLSAAAGSTNRWFNILDATFPTVAAGVITAKATFLSADGNFAWNEFGIDIGTPTVTSANTVNATLLNRAVISQGTKTAGQSWTASATITLV
jgi:hypothetical protein